MFALIKLCWALCEARFLQPRKVLCEEGIDSTSDEVGVELALHLSRDLAAAGDMADDVNPA